MEDCTRLGAIVDPREADEVATRAVDEMQDLIADQERVHRRHRRRVDKAFAFTVASAGLTLAGGPLTAIGAMVAFLSVGKFFFDQPTAGAGDGFDAQAVVKTSRRTFGWRDDGAAEDGR